MAIEHSTLTGSQLHEPKGAAAASVNQVYVSDGTGSGVWTDLLASIYNRNLFSLGQTFNDLAAAESIYFNVPYKSELVKMTVMLYGTLDVDTTLSIYIGGVLFADDLTIVAAGSGAGQKKTLLVVTANSIPANTIVEVRGDGAATTSVKGYVQLELEAVV